MGQTVNQFKQLLENRKNELSQIQDAAQKKQKTAELILLTHMYNKYGNGWDRPQMKKQFETQILNFNPEPKYTQTIARIKTNMDNLTVRLACTEPRPFPEELYPYAAEPEKLTNEKMKDIRNTLYGKGYPFDIYKVPGEGMGEEQLKAIHNDLGLKPDNIKEEVTPLTVKFIGQNETVLKRFDNYTAPVGLLTGRGFTNSSTFRFYLMAKKGLSVQDAMKYGPDSEGFENDFKEFEQFLKDHPIKDTETKKLSDEERDQNTKEWLDVFGKASDKFAEYKIPDIDYNNPEAVEPYRNEFLFLSPLITDLEQQVEPFLSAAAPSLSRLKGEEVKLKAKMKPAQEIRKFSSAFATGNTLPEALLRGNPKAAAKTTAVQKIVFANEVAPKYKGKTGKELGSDVTVKSLYDGIAQLRMVQEANTHDQITFDNAKEYLQSGGGNLKDVVLDHYQTLLATTRKESANQEQISHGQSVFVSKVQSEIADNPHYKGVLRDLFNSGLSGEDILAKFKVEEDRAVENDLDVLFDHELSEQMAQRQADRDYLIEKVDFCFRKLFVDNGQVDYYRLAGVDNPLGTIRVNGKTAEELWGEKYKNIENPADKELLYKLEIINAMVNTIAHVTMDHYMINDNDQIVPNGTIDLCDDRLHMERKKSFLREVETLGTKMREIKAATAERPQWLQPGAQALRDEMGRKADAVIKECNLRFGLYGKLKPALEEYELAAENFYNNQISLMHTNNRGQAEIALAEQEKRKALNDIREIKNNIEKYAKNLKVENSDLELGANDSARYQFAKIKSEIEQSVKLKGLSEAAAELHQEEALPEELGWIDQIDDADEELTNEQTKLLKEASGFFDKQELDRMTANYTTSIMDIMNMQNVGETGKTGAKILDENGFGTREGTLQCYFASYLMSEKGLSAKDALEIGNTLIPVTDPKTGEVKYPAGREQTLQYEKDFMQFVLNYPIEKENADKETTEKSIGKWAKVFRNAHMKVKEYKLPDIDYTDPKQVKDHFEKLYYLGIFSGDAFQEFDAMARSSANTKYSSVSNVAAKEMGGYKNFWDTYRFFNDMQGLTLVGYRNGNELKEYKSVCRIGFMAAGRFLGGRMMNKIGGKTLGDGITLLRPSISILEDSIMSTGGMLNKYVYTTQFPVESLVNSKKGLQYLFGFNRESLEQTADALEKDALSGVGRDRFALNSHFKMGIFDAEPWPEGLRERFSSVGESAQDMEKFLAENATETCNVIDWADNQISGMFDMGRHGLIHEYGFNDSDMFLIDGQTPAQKYGEKYAHIQDPDEKERYFKAEIMRSIASGRQEVKVRNLYLETDGRITEGPATLRYMKRDKVTEFVNEYQNYKLQRKNLLSRLNQMKKNLAETQQNPKSNFTRGEGEEGSPEYRAYTKSIQECIDKLSGWNGVGEKAVFGAQLRTALQNLERNAKAYYEKRKGFLFGPQSKEGVIRLLESEKASTGLVSQFDALRRTFQSDQYVNGRTLKESSERDLEIYYKKVHDSFLKVPVQNEAETEDAYARAEIKRLLDMYKNSVRIKEINTKPELKNEKNAADYLFGRYEYLMGPAPVGEETKKFTLEDIRDVEKFPERLEFLAKHAPFQMAMNNNPERTIRLWQQLEADTASVTTAKKTEYDNRIKESGSLSDYVAGNNAAVQPAMPAAETIKRINNIEDPVERQNERIQLGIRLTEAIVMQMQSSDSPDTLFFRTLVTGKSALLEGFKNTIHNYILEKGYLENDKIEDTLRRLENGELRREAMDQITRKSSIDRANRLANEKEKIAESLGKVGFITNAQGNLTEQQFEDYAAETGFDMANTFAKEFNDSADLLKQPISYTVTQPGQNQGDPEVVVAKNVQPDAEVFKNVGISQRNDALQSLFVSWVMAQKGKEFKEALKICTTTAWAEENKEEANQANRFRAEFYEFCEKNQILALQKAGNKEEAERAVREWANVYKKASDMMKSYEFPNINYRNKEEIKTNMKELVGVTGFIGNVRQEYKKFFESSQAVNAKRIAAEEIGRKGFDDSTNFWIGLETATSSFRQGYCTKKEKSLYAGKSINAFKNDILVTAVNRKLGSDRMQKTVGLKAEQIVDLMGKTNGLLTEKNKNMMVVSAAADGGYDALSTAAITNYMTGINRSGVEKSVTVLEGLKSGDVYGDVLNAQFNAIVTFRDNFDFAGQMETLANLPDGNEHVQEMLDYLNSTLENGKSVKDWMADRFDLLFNEGTRTTFILAGVAPIDTLMIGNMTVREKFADKYAGIEDEKLKEQLLCLEFIKEMAIGREDLVVRTFELSENGLTESAIPAIAVLNRDSMQRFSYSVHAYEIGRREMISDLMPVIEALKNTQQNREYNFSSLGSEGGEEYRKMTTDLSRVYAFLRSEDNSDLTQKQILNALNKLEQSARTYKETHTGWFVGRWHAYGRQRLEQSDRLLKMVPMLKQRFLGIRKDIDCNMAVWNGKNAQEAPFSRIKEVNGKLEGKFNLEVKDADFYDYYFKVGAVNRALNKLRNRQLPEQNAENIRRVIRYLEGYFVDRRDTGELTMEDVKYLEDEGRITARINELANNPIFQKCMEDNPDYAIENWRAIEEIAREMRESAASQVQNVINRYGAAEAFIAGLEGPEQNVRYTKQDAYNKMIADNQIYAERSNTYERLATLMLARLLAEDSEFSYRLRLYIAMGDSVENQIISYVKNGLRMSNALDGDHFVRTFEAMHTGQLKEEVRQIIMEAGYLNGPNPAAADENEIVDNPVEEQEIILNEDEPEIVPNLNAQNINIQNGNIENENAGNEEPVGNVQENDVNNSINVNVSILNNEIPEVNPNADVHEEENRIQNQNANPVIEDDLDLNIGNDEFHFNGAGVNINVDLRLDDVFRDINIEPIPNADGGNDEIDYNEDEYNDAENEINENEINENKINENEMKEEKKAEPPKNEIKEEKKPKPKNIIIEEDEEEKELVGPGPEDERAEYMKSAKVYEDELKQMGKGAYNEKGEIDLQKAGCIIKAATAYEMSKRKSFGIFETGKGIESKLFGNKESRIGLVVLMENLDGANINQLIQVGNFKKGIEGLYENCSEEKKRIIEELWKDAKVKHANSSDPRMRDVVSGYGEPKKNNFAIIGKSSSNKKPGGNEKESKNGKGNDNNGTFGKNKGKPITGPGKK